MPDPRYELRPIGQARVSQGTFTLHVEEAFRPALEGLEDFSHAIVVFWCHLVDSGGNREVVSCDRPYRIGPARLGTFATRSPVRPNPIGITPVALIRIDASEGIIHIPFLDAEDGTPILDIKPYHPSIDRIREFRLPSWCEHWPKWSEDSAAFDWAAEFSVP